ncbi:MAG: hypothetical protein JRG92_13935 [Deltaproteobacteria bacterium]|jgi:hypothetical protein|nr:hypothetical protein [Deltaproteobacteria bacterium]MBW2384732.1 hypothetical protein [Deltaproteobacteria bacterium]MBW2696198.1 hypothetical protein [Deltaproteobacteria bacterium]
MMGVATARYLGEGVYSHLMEKTGTASSTFALWSSMHDSGQLKSSLDKDAHEIILDLEDFAHPSPEMCTITSAFIEETLRISGQSGGVRKVGCVLSGDACCRWKAS